MTRQEGFCWGIYAKVIKISNGYIIELGEENKIYKEKFEDVQKFLKKKIDKWRD